MVAVYNSSAYLHQNLDSICSQSLENIEIILDVDGDYVNITYDPPFEFKAYRGTDYLVNDAEKLNDSKLAELREKIANEI